MRRRHRALHWRRAAFLLLWSGGAALAQLPLPPSPTPEEEVRPIAPPVEVFPYPLWMVLTAGALALLLLGGIVWFAVRYWRNRPAPPAPTPREVAQGALARLREKAASAEPYPFSVEVSDVLRRYVTEEYGVSAVARTSPEFLAEAARSSRFSEGEKALLGLFLEKADLIKFARIDATADDCEQLLEQALRFVKGGAHESL